MNIFSSITGQEQIICQWDEHGIWLYYINMLYWIFIVLTHWNNSPLVDMLIYSGIFTQITNQQVFTTCHSCCVAYIYSREATHTSCIVFCLTRPASNPQLTPLEVLIIIQPMQSSSSSSSPSSAASHQNITCSWWL